MRPTTAAGAGLLALGAAAARCAPAVAPHAPAMAAVLGVPRRLDALAGAVALTFDDGPHPDGTPAVLEALREHEAVATFFVVGEQVRRAPALVDEIRAAGHAVALHGDRHRVLVRLPAPAVRDDLDRLAATVPDALPVHRAPLGIYTRSALAEVRRRGWTPLLWSRWGRDWRARASPAGVAADVTRDLRAGDVLLLHDADTYSAPGSWRTTAAALPAILEAIAAAGLRTAAISAEPADCRSRAARTNGGRPPSR